MYYLAGDIGGTKALLQLIQLEPGSLSSSASLVSQAHVIGEQKYACCEFDSLESIVACFLQSLSTATLQDIKVKSACFGLPGPVSSRQVELTNLPWLVDADVIEDVCKIETVSFVNDFYAAALGVDALSSESKIALYKNNAVDDALLTGNRLVVGAGTGLGLAPVFYDGHHYLPQSSEGGHFEFAPISETQQVLLNWLWQKWEHVSYERVLSGPGLETLYEFFLLHDLPNSYSQISSQKLHKNKLPSLQNKQVGLLLANAPTDKVVARLNAPEIHQAAEVGEHAAVKALIEFVTIYGAFVGAAALIWNAPGGIYLAGGVASKLEKWMQKEFFVTAFLEKGRMTKVVETMPIYLVTDESLGLKGAMQAAMNNMAG